MNGLQKNICYIVLINQKTTTTKMKNTYNITSSFHDFYNKCKNKRSPGIKIIAFPTGMGKTHGAANNAIQIAEHGDLPIFIAPRIAILKDFENTVIDKYKFAEIVRIISDTELKQVQYYLNNINSFKKIADNIEQELITFIKQNSINLNLPLNMLGLEIYFSNLDFKKVKTNKELYSIFKIFKATKSIKDIYRQFNLVKNNLQQEDVKNEFNSKLWQVYNSIIDVFEASNFFFIKKGNSSIYIDSKEIYKIYGFNSFDRQIVKDFFGLSFIISDIKNNLKNNNYFITLTSKKSLKYIGRLFEVKNEKLVKITGTESNNLFFNKYINTFCKSYNILPIYYIDEADEFYNEIVEEKTKTIHLNNFLFKIKTFFDYSSISSLLSFINKIENNKITNPFSLEFKELMFNYNNCFTADKIENFISLFENNKIDFHPNIVISDKKFIAKINSEIRADFGLFSIFQNFKNKENVLFLFLCFLDSLGITNKIEQLEKSDKPKHTLFLGDLYKSLKNSKEFLTSWNSQNNDFVLDTIILFNELNNINNLLISSNLGETIIKNEDFIELAENNKFMFGNDNLSLVEEQIKYLNNLQSVESYSDNALLEMNGQTIKNNSISLSYIFSFLTKVLIRTVQDLSVPNEYSDEERTLDKEMSCNFYLKKMKTAFSKLSKINDSEFKIKDESLLFDENYIFNQDKNVINLFTTNYDKNIKFGKPNISSYIQISNIYIQESPEKELLNYFSVIDNKKILDFGSNSVIFLMSATSTINSYFGNFDYEYLFKNVNSNNILYETTYTNNQDINLVNSFKLPYLNKKVTDIQTFDYDIYANRQFQLYDDFYHLIKNSNNKSIDILTGENNKYKLYEFQSFVFSIENLILNNQINSLFFISQTTSHIISFINFYLSDLLNQSSKLLCKFSKNGEDFDNIFIINKDVFNTEYPMCKLDKDLIIIFYDAKFENKQKESLNSLLNQNYPNISKESNIHLDDEKDMSNPELDSLDFSYEKLKKEIFNEDKYKILLCSSFGSVSKGFNFVTQKNNDEKDFDSINIGMDPYYDNLSQDKDESLVYQRIVSMKDFNFMNNRACNLNELTDYFYLNRTFLLKKEHLASISRIIIQSLGRIERRRHKNNNGMQFLLINKETYKKMEKFYHFYEYDRYINSKNSNTKDSFSSNLSVNNQYLFDLTQKTTLNNYISNYPQHVTEQIEKNNILEELVSFLLFKIRKNNKTKKDFKEIWEYLKSSTIFHNLKDYLKILNHIIAPKLISLMKKYVIQKEYPYLFNFINSNKYILEDIFFVKFPKKSTIGLSIERDNQNNPYEIIVDYDNANKSDYDFFKMIFNVEKEDFSKEALNYIKWLNSQNSVEEVFKEKYTIDDILYVPQRKIAIEFIKTAISEEIFKNVLEKHKFKLFSDIDDNSYELFDFFIQHNNKKEYSAIDVKFWSIATQALNSKNIEEKVNKKTYVTDLSSVKNILCINLFGKTKNSNFKNRIYYKNFFIKDQVRSSSNYGKYILNQKIINFLKEEIQK
jgi:hypothetical protein